MIASKTSAPDEENALGDSLESPDYEDFVSPEAVQRVLTGMADLKEEEPVPVGAVTVVEDEPVVVISTEEFPPIVRPEVPAAPEATSSQVAATVAQGGSPMSSRRASPPQIDLRREGSGNPDGKGGSDWRWVYLTGLAAAAVVGIWLLAENLAGFRDEPRLETPLEEVDQPAAVEGASPEHAADPTE